MKNLVLAFAALLAFASCKKDTTVTTTKPETEMTLDKNIKTVSEKYSNGTSELSTYVYDMQGRLTSEKEEYDGMLRITTYDYSTPGKIICSRTDNGQLMMIYEATLNSQQKVSDMVVKYANGTEYANYKFTYDTNGYMIKKEWSDINGSTNHFDYKIENGNVVEYKLYYDGILDYTAFLTFDSAKKNSINYATGGHWRGHSFGKTNKNMIIRAKTVDASGKTTWDNNYTHHYAATGYVEKTNTNNLVTNFSSETSYTYY